MIESAKNKIEEFFKLSRKRFVYWLLGFVLGPFCLFFVLVFFGSFVLFGSDMNTDRALFMAGYCGALAAFLGLIAFAISLIGLRYWFLVAAYVIPSITVGGFWGTWGWFKSIEDFGRSYPDQTRDQGLLEMLFEWLSFVKDGCVEMALLPTFLIGTGICLTFFYYSRKKPDQ